MKKITVLFLAGLFLCLLAACGSSNSEPEASTQPASSAPAPPEVSSAPQESSQQGGDIVSYVADLIPEEYQSELIMIFANEGEDDPSKTELRILNIDFGTTNSEVITNESMDITRKIMADPPAPIESIFFLVDAQGVTEYATVVYDVDDDTFIVNSQEGTNLYNLYALNS